MDVVAGAFYFLYDQTYFTPGGELSFPGANDKAIFDTLLGALAAPPRGAVTVTESSGRISSGVRVDSRYRQASKRKTPVGDFGSREAGQRSPRVPFTVTPDSGARRRSSSMQSMKFYVDTHDRTHKTFPEGITREQFATFFVQYEQAARAEGVVVLRLHVGFEEGRAFCFNMAPNADAVRRVHERVGLPFDQITEVTTATPGDLFFVPRT